MIPSRESAAFIWRMEEVLDLYEKPYDPLLPVVCFDERPCQLIGDVIEPLPPKPGQPARIDSHYQRGGTCHVLMAFEPLTGWREARVTERRRKREFADSMRHLAEEVYPEAEKIRVVLDNLSSTPLLRSTRASPQRLPANSLEGSSSSTPRCMARG